MATWTMHEATALAETLTETIPGVQAARAWTTPDGRQLRVYVDLTKHNGGRAWNGGVGHRVVVDLRAGTVALDRRCEWAGARTAAYHEQAGTLAAIEAAVHEAAARLTA